MPSPPSRGLAGCSDSSGMQRRKMRVEVEEGVGKHKDHKRLTVVLHFVASLSPEIEAGRVSVGISPSLLLSSAKMPD